jgi:hypothetical protein
VFVEISLPAWACDLQRLLTRDHSHGVSYRRWGSWRTTARNSSLKSVMVPQVAVGEPDSKLTHLD